MKNVHLNFIRKKNFFSSITVEVAALLLIKDLARKCREVVKSAALITILPTPTKVSVILDRVQLF